ncbi:YhcH/YjgK/YiaL family protein [bacterium]|nr:YhcH/YjgK/YiaL family protein [bacterium]
MILDILENTSQYQSLNPLFQTAFKFLQRSDLMDLPNGRHEIDGDAVRAIVSRGPGRRPDENRLEAHAQYLDIQVVLDGVEKMGWKPCSSCTEPDGEMDPVRDVLFYGDTPDAWVTVHAGRFAIFFPEDAHLPLVSDGNIHKVVVKVRM